MLVVDHNPRRRAVLLRRLAGRRFVAVAASLEEASLLLALHTPRVVFVGDLPAGDGNLLMHALLRDRRLRRTRVRGLPQSLSADDGHRLHFGFKRSLAA